MSHEIRTPMNAIIGFSELLSSCDFDEKQKQEFSQLIARRSYDLLHIIEDILDISKIELSPINRLLSSIVSGRQKNCIPPVSMVAPD